MGKRGMHSEEAMGDKDLHANLVFSLPAKTKNARPSINDAAHERYMPEARVPRSQDARGSVALIGDKRQW